MPNVNCLEGIECPRCGHEEEFVIGISTTAEVTDEGVGDIVGDNEWSADSSIQCSACKHVDAVKDFTITTMRERVVKCMVPCLTLSGDPDLWAVRILCTKNQWETGKHFRPACKVVEDEGHTVGSFDIVFDYDFGGWGNLEESVVWETIPIVDIRPRKPCPKK